MDFLDNPEIGQDFVVIDECSDGFTLLKRYRRQKIDSRNDGKRETICLLGRQAN